MRSALNYRVMAALLAAAGLLPAVAPAQSLEEQYADLLSAKCTQMDFTRDEFGDLLPGQAGPALDAFCSGLPLVQGPGSVAASASNGFAASSAAAERPDQVTLVAGARSSVFASINHVREDQDPGRFEGGSQARMLAVMLGADRRAGDDGALVGIAARFEDLAGDFSAGGDFGHRGLGALVYGSWLPLPATFIDVAAGLTFRNSQTRRIVSFTRTYTPPADPLTPVVIESIAPARVDSKTDHEELLVELNTGHDFRAGATTVGPRLSLAYRRMAIDGAVESGASPMALVIDDQSQRSLRTGLGLEASRVINKGPAVYVLQFNADWWHEFQDDQRVIQARFAEDLRPEPSRLQYQNEPPDRDVFVARASLGVTMRQGWSAFAAVDALLGHSYLRRHGVAIGLRKEL
jgi:hypothetical protein